MKTIYSKIPAMIAMLMTILCFVMLMVAILIPKIEIEPEHGANKSFIWFTFSFIFALFSLFFYFVDTVISVIKIFKKIDPVLNGLLALVMIGTYPALLLLSRILPGISIIVWVAVIFVLEFISMAKHIKVMMSDRKREELFLPPQSV